MIKTVTTHIKRSINLQILSAAIVIGCVATLGDYLITNSHAMGPYTSTYASSGQLGGSASLVSGSGDAGGKAVQFGSASGSGGGSAIFGIYHDNSTIADLTAFYQATGVQPVLNEVYEDGGQSSEQAYISGSSFSYTGDAGTSYRLLIGLNMCAGSSSSPIGSLAAGASGAYNSAYQTFAQNMVNAGFGNAIIRIGVEIYGNWESCYLTNSTDAANFATYYQQAVTAMPSVAG